jgi:hypothetical protein
MGVERVSNRLAHFGNPRLPPFAKGVGPGQGDFTVRSTFHKATSELDTQ